MRGAREMKEKDLRANRIIPADAGSTIRRSCFSTAMKDHPRGCGEHSSRFWARTYARGSSPRMRGAHVCATLADGTVRIIPADAGSTLRPARSPARRRDHPRGCGEHCWRTHWHCSALGSSPRMRGALRIAGRRRGVGGIIPADAGSTGFIMHFPAFPRDHPRGCGEHIGNR